MRSYEEIIQFEQALIELDEQNTMNAMEIRKREAKVFLIKKQIEDGEEDLHSKENKVDQDVVKKEMAHLNKVVMQQKEQILILNESTKSNLHKHQSMKLKLYENYQAIR